MSEADYLLSIAVTFFAWVAVLLTSLFATAEAMAFTWQTHRKKARAVGVVAIVHAGIAIGLAVFIVAVLVQPTAPINPKERDYTEHVHDWFGVFSIVVSVSAAFSAVLLMSIKTQLSRLTDERDNSAENAVYVRVSQTRSCRLAFAGLSLVALVIAVPFLLIPLFVLVALGIPFFVLTGSNRRPTQLLWLLAVAVKHRRNVAEELRAHAIGQSVTYGRRLIRCADSIDAGDSLAEALMQVRGLLPRWTVAEIRVAEEIGTLDSILSRLAKQQLDGFDWDLTKVTLTSWAVYGFSYVMAGVAIIGFLMVFIVPKFKHIFYGFGTELPKTTEMAIKLSDCFAAYWFLGAPLMWGLVWLGIEVMRGEASRWKHLRFRILSPLYRVLDAPDILRQLGVVVGAGRSLADGLTAMGQFHDRPSVAKLLARVAIDVQAGDDCFAMLRQQRLITEADEQFLSSAQRVGNLAWALNELAEIRERRLSHRCRFFLEAFRPVPVLIAGALVFFLVVAFFMPIVKLVNDLS